MANNNKMYLYRLNDTDKENIKPDVMSYGELIGSFLTNDYTMSKYALDERFNKKYCFVPRKSEYYMLMWDFDLKEETFKNDFCSEEQFINYINDFDNIVLTITNLIKDTLNEVYETPDTKYIVADKNIGVGYHLYFPNITVNKQTHAYIYHSVLEKLIRNYLYPIKLINHIFDACISKANGLRYFYFHYKNAYYKPNLDYSTFLIEEDKNTHFKYCLINSAKKSIHPALKIDYETIDNFVHKKNKNTKNNKNIQDEIELIKDFIYVDLKDKKKMFLELTECLSIGRNNKYEFWICIVFLFKTYGLYEEIIEFSKKSKKFSNDAVKLITQIFNNKTVPKNMITLGTLIKWASEDNFFKTVDILEKYGINIKLNINNVNEILLLKNKDKINYKEQNTHISDTAVNEIINKIDNLENDAFLLQSPTGSGKSTAIFKIAKAIKKYNYSILAITTRRSMSSTLKNAFNKTKNEKGELIDNGIFNFSSYLDKIIENDEHFISSLEHLFLFKQFYDVVILDEVFSLCSYFYSDTLKGRRHECLLHLQNLIENAKIVIACDAQIADICFSLLKNKKIYFYQNTFKNKLSIPFKINISTHNNDDSNLTHISKIIGENYCKKKKQILIVSDSKKTIDKLFALLKKYNNDDDYFRVFTSKQGTKDDLDNIDYIAKNRCLLFSPKIIYGIDLLTKYDDIFCIYSKISGTNSMSAFEMYQQVSRSRDCKIVNVYILNSNVESRYNKYISFEKNKLEEEASIKNYIYYTDKIYKKHSRNKEITSINEYYKDIHFYKSWYDRIFSNNKLQILKLLATQFGFTITETKFTAVKVKAGLNKLLKENKNLLIELSKKIIKNETIDSKYNEYIDNIKEQINNRKKYISDKNPNYLELIADDKKFDDYIKRKLLDSSKEKFEKKLININNTDEIFVLKDHLINNQIESLFWLEEQLKINRYEVDKIDPNIKVDDFVKLMKNNINILVYLFRDYSNRGDKYIKEQIKKIFEKMNSYNKIQKFYVKCVNNICDNTFKIKTIRTNSGYNINYNFNLLE